MKTELEKHEDFVQFSCPKCGSIHKIKKDGTVETFANEEPPSSESDEDDFPEKIKEVESKDWFDDLFGENDND